MSDDWKARYNEAYGTFAAHVWYERLKFCGCGTPDDVAEALKASLTLLAERTDASRAEPRGVPYEESAWAKHCAAMDARMQEIWTPERVRYLVWYVLCAADLEEHGGSVPGWPTDDGPTLCRRARDP